MIVHHRFFTFLISFVIVLNAIYIGVETDYAEEGNGADSNVWQVIEYTFTSVFLVELCLRIFGERSAFKNDAWNLFDSVLVTVATVDTFILSTFLSNEAMDVFAAMRIVRL